MHSKHFLAQALNQAIFAPPTPMDQEIKNLKLGHIGKMNAGKLNLSGTATIGDMDKPQWKDLLGKYPDVDQEETTRKVVVSEESGDTAFHMAISSTASASKKTVETSVKTVETILDALEELDEKGRKNVLMFGNSRGNTPLHLAALNGKSSLCKRITDIEKDSMGARNHDGETPLFMAALHGQKDAFYSLHNSCSDLHLRQKYSKRTKDWDNILHAAIAGDYFDLAFFIAESYEYLVYDYNQRGLSPLHILAGKPAAFKSGSTLGWLDSIIYDYISVEDKKENTAPENHGTRTSPENHGTSLNCFRQIGKFVQGKQSSAQQIDVEKGKGENLLFGDTESQEHGLFTSKCRRCIASVMLSYGYRGIKTIREQKEKHTWAFLLADKMVEVDAKYKREHGLEKQRKISLHSWLEKCMHDMIENFVDKEGTIITGLKNRLVEKIKKYVAESSLGETVKQLPAWIPVEKILDEFSGDAAKLAVSNTLDALEKFTVEEKDVIKEKLKHGVSKMIEQFLGRSSTLTISLKNYLPYIKELVDEVSEDVVETPEKKPFAELKKWLKEIEEKIVGTGVTPLLVASKMGVTEMIEIILNYLPVAIHDVDSIHGKNAVHFAVENRQIQVYKLLRTTKYFNETAFRHTDNEGNSALHLAATLSKSLPNSHIPGPVLQMQLEIKWFQAIKKSMHSFSTHYNHDGKTADDIFTEKHEELVKKGSEWLDKTCQSCCVVATFIAPAAFSTSATIPSDIKSPTAVLSSEEHVALKVFSVSSLVALCSSVISLIIFLSVLNSQHREKDFKSRLPRKFLSALGLLLVSIITTLICFCSSHFLSVKSYMNFNVFPIYAFLSIVLPLIILFQFPLYYDFLKYFFSSIQELFKRKDQQSSFP